jgi:hypothetical protein
MHLNPYRLIRPPDCCNRARTLRRQRTLAEGIRESVPRDENYRADIAGAYIALTEIQI